MVDDEVIARAKWGDRVALGEIFREHHPAILRYLKGLATSNAEDVASQVWVDAASSLGRFEGDNDDLRRWLFTIARRRMIDAFRSRSRRPEQPIPALSSIKVAVGADVAFEGTEWATRALSQLPPAQAEVVYLRAVVGLTVSEVAAMIDKSPGAVRVLAHRGHERLLMILNEPTRDADEGLTAARTEAARRRRVDAR